MGLVQDLLAYARSGVSTPEKVTSDAVAKALRCLRDGTLSIVDFKIICALEGLLMVVDVGSLVTPIAGHVAISQLQPEVNIDVPAGTSIIVFPPNVYLETSAGTLTRVVMASLPQLMGEATSNAATVGPLSTRTDKRGKVSGNCDARQAYSAGGAAIAAPVVQVEHWRSGYPFADAAGSPVKRFQPSVDEWPFPVLVGPASFQIYWAATTTAPSGWAQIQYVELPSNQIV